MLAFVLASMLIHSRSNLRKEIRKEKCHRSILHSVIKFKMLILSKLLKFKILSMKMFVSLKKENSLKGRVPKVCPPQTHGQP